MFKPLFLAGVLFCAAAQGATTFELSPPGGALEGGPNVTVGWGFTLTNTENYLVVTSASFEPNTALGTFTDFISAQFFVVGPGPDASPVWTQPFDDTAQTGVGSFQLSGAPPGSIANGEILLTYDLFSRSPLDTLFDPNTDTLSVGNSLTAAASVTVVPLPSAVWLLGSGIALLSVLCRGKRPKV